MPLGCIAIIVVLAIIGLIINVVEGVASVLSTYWLSAAALFLAYFILKGNKDSKKHDYKTNIAVLLIIFGVFSGYKKHASLYKVYDLIISTSDENSEIKIYNADGDDVAFTAGSENHISLKKGSYSYKASRSDDYETTEGYFNVPQDQKVNVQLPKRSIVSDNDTNYETSNSYSSDTSSSTYTYDSSSESSYSTPSPSHSKDVYVHGYTRRNGTYVAPYYRSRPH
ncbi:hypothetical protein [Deinococcus hopiensis]|uniref:Uncharacterized protein n=1 Tax=Deinococcus hopiensis KR-140 TaxID=695939 RepID=A0A1W1UMN8_9DEIO|nr:hypothetical protein [Deinococcus hopiensis]SMB81974.1 hypothetical protein SAMN00790413_04797 [Deinococcus hopiensis KR-140]